MKVIVDRIENDFCVVELKNGTFCNLPLLLVPSAKEGDVIEIKILNDETDIRKKNIKKLVDKVFK